MAAAAPTLSFILLCFVSLLSLFAVVNARIPGVYTGGTWESAHATFYGGSDASGTMGNISSPLIFVNFNHNFIQFFVVKIISMAIKMCVIFLFLF